MKSILVWSIIGAINLITFSLLFNKTLIGVGVGFLCLIIGLFVDDDVEDAHSPYIGRRVVDEEREKREHEEWLWFNHIQNDVNLSKGKQRKAARAARELKKGNSKPMKKFIKDNNKKINPFQ